MQQARLEIESTREMISRPVAHSITAALADYLDLDENTQILIPGEGNREKLPTDRRRRRGGDELTRLSATIDVQENYDLDRIATTQTEPFTQPTLFWDPHIGVSLTPIYARSSMDLEISIQFDSAQQARLAQNHFRRRLLTRESALYHELHYRYLIPQELTALLFQIYKLRENRAAYGETVNQYFDQYFSDRVTTASDRSGDNPRFLKEESQLEVIGRFTNYENILEDLEYQDNETQVTLDFTYRVIFDKPISIVAEYPIIVHNQPLSSDYYDKGVPYEPTARNRLASKASEAFEPFRFERSLRWPPGSVDIPYYMLWHPPQLPSAVVPLVRVNLHLSPSNPDDRFSVEATRDLIDLDAIRNYEPTDRFVDFLIDELPHVLEFGHSPLWIRCYANDKPIDNRRLEITDQSMLRFADTVSHDELEPHNPNLRYPYNLVICAAVNLHIVNKDGLERMCNHPWETIMLLDAIDPRLHGDGMMPYIYISERQDREYLKISELRQAIDHIHQRTVPRQGFYSKYSVYDFRKFLNPEPNYIRDDDKKTTIIDLRLYRTDTLIRRFPERFA